ncbi:hypothetical protein KY330_01585 [Candidatus Woesearchaeota archaeon]|nr:hypothetical protein [Candidatus Woesearchaeota archaeon]
MDKKIGSYAFLVLIAIAILAGLIPDWQGATWVVWTLFLLGLAVGLLNVTKKETTGFLVAAIALIVLSNALPNLNIALPTALVQIFDNIILFVAPALLVVGLKAIYDYAEKK